MRTGRNQFDASWTEGELFVLRSFYDETPRVEMLLLLPGRSWSSISHKASRLGIERVPQITEAGRAGRRAWAQTGNARRGKFLSPLSERDGVIGKYCLECLTWKPLEKFAVHRDCPTKRSVCTRCAGKTAYASNRERCIAGVRRYQRRHPKRVRLCKQARERVRRGRILIGPGVKAGELRQLMQSFEGRCGYCGAPATSFDHRIPLARGGEHGIANLIPACAPCNMRKHVKTEEEFRAILGKGL